MQYDPSLNQPFQAELESGERLLWTGRADPVRSALGAFAIWFFAIPWTAFSVNFMLMWRNHDWASYIFQGSFVLIGVGLLSTPLWTYLRARATLYGITQQRIILLTTGRTRTVQSFRDEDLNHIVRTERADGSGDLTFAQRSYRDSDGDRRTQNFTMVGILNVREVERLVRSVLLKEDSK